MFAMKWLCLPSAEPWTQRDLSSGIELHIPASCRLYVTLRLRHHVHVPVTASQNRRIYGNFLVKNGSASSAGCTGTTTRLLTAGLWAIRLYPYRSLWLWAYTLLLGRYGAARGIYGPFTASRGNICVPKNRYKRRWVQALWGIGRHQRLRKKGRFNSTLPSRLFATRYGAEGPFSTPTSSFLAEGERYGRATAQCATGECGQSGNQPSQVRRVLQTAFSNSHGTYGGAKKIPHERGVGVSGQL